MRRLQTGGPVFYRMRRFEDDIPVRVLGKNDDRGTRDIARINEQEGLAAIDNSFAAKGCRRVPAAYGSPQRRGGFFRKGQAIDRIGFGEGKVADKMNQSARARLLPRQGQEKAQASKDGSVHWRYRGFRVRDRRRS